MFLYYTVLLLFESNHVGILALAASHVCETEIERGIAFSRLESKILFIFIYDSLNKILRICVHKFKSSEMKSALFVNRRFVLF